MQINNKSVAIVGAGIAGLCTAYWLEKQGYDVTVFEKHKHIGGAIITKKENGFLMDLGPNSTLETSEVLKKLVTEIGLDDQKIYGNEESNKRYIIKKGQLTPVPTSLPKFLSTNLFSWKAKFRLLKEPFIKASDNPDISLAEFVKRRLGQEFLDYAINPFVAGVYAGDPKQLSTAAGFPKLYALEQKYGSLIKGAFLGARERKKRKEVAKDRAKLFSFKNGMSTFPERLASKLKREIQIKTDVTLIEPAGNQFQLQLKSENKSSVQTFDKVVMCIPTHAIARIFSGIKNGEKEALLNVQHPPINVVFLGYKKEDIQRPLDGFGFLIPEKENRRILGAIWSSTIFPGRAPEGCVAITCFVGGTRQPEMAQLPDDQLIEMVSEELNTLMKIKNNPVHYSIKRWPKAIPQYAIGYQGVQTIFSNIESSFPGLHFAGNYRRGISVGDSVLSAFEICQSIQEQTA